jgi:hypothetical protein
MAKVAGLGAVSVAALFTTCLDCFNIIVNAKEFGHEHELLCRELSLQKLRFFLWGESVGLVSRQSILPGFHRRQGSETDSDYNNYSEAESTLFKITEPMEGGNS